MQRSVWFLSVFFWPPLFLVSPLTTKPSTKWMLRNTQTMTIGKIARVENMLKLDLLVLFFVFLKSKSLIKNDNCNSNPIEIDWINDCYWLAVVDSYRSIGHLRWMRKRRWPNPPQKGQKKRFWWWSSFAWHHYNLSADWRKSSLRQPLPQWCPVLDRFIVRILWGKDWVGGTASNNQSQRELSTDRYLFRVQL